LKSFGLRIFRVTAGAWIGELALPLVFFTVLSITAVNQAGLPLLAAAAGMIILAIVASTEYLAPMLRSWIEFDRSTIEGSLNGRRFHMFYGEVLAAWIFERRRQRYLCLGTRSGTIMFPLLFFDSGAVWEEVRLRLPAETLGEKAILRMPDYQSWASERAGVRMDVDSVRVVADNWILQVIGWGGLVFAALSAASAILAQAYLAAIAFGLVGGLCMVMVLRWGITEFTAAHIRRITLFRVSGILWPEVKWIEVDPFGISMVLGGNGCQLVIPGPAIWSTMQRRTVQEMFETQVFQRKIPVRRTVLALVKFSHRTRMSR
jgi:hypothetical protein